MSTVAAVDPDALLAELVATPEGRADPYPRYATLRARSPVHRSAFGFWALSRYDDCQQLLRHPGVGKDFSGALNSLGLTDEQRSEQDRFPQRPLQHVDHGSTGPHAAARAGYPGLHATDG